MRHKIILVPAVLLFIAAVSLATVKSTRQTPPSSLPQAPFALRISFGHGESLQERWTGTVTVQQAEISESKGWLLREEDRLSLDTFDFQTIRGRARRSDPKGILLRGEADPAATIQVVTNRGDFSFRISELEPGVELDFLNQGVQVSGLQSTAKLTDDSRDDDYPSIAVLDDTTAWAVWQSYSGQVDEIRLSKYEGSWRTFTRVPGTSGDVWRPQVALDKEKRLWVVWSQQVEGNFDLYARALDEEENRWLELTRLSSHPHPDIDHHLISDTQGNLWVVWQGFHGDNSDIFLRQYDGSGWSEEIRVTDSPANDWEPQIAVDAEGRAHIVWDSYRNRNYDVFLRSYANGLVDPEVAVADTAGFEAHASVAVDQAGRVWVAWEEGGSNWGKDSGPTIDPQFRERGREIYNNWISHPSSPGTRLYESRKLNLAVFEGGERKVPVQDLETALLEMGIHGHDSPQLLIDPGSGRVGLMFHRWNQVGEWSPVLFSEESSSYREQAVTFYEGDHWSPVVAMPESWGRLSMRSDGAFAPDGSLWVVWPVDGRLSKRSHAPVVGNIYAARIPLPGTSGAAELKAWEAPRPMEIAPVHPNEATEVATIRSYRSFVRGVENRIVRGDFHRHTELSLDTAGGLIEGSLFDFYRYMLDVAAMDFGAVTDHNGGGDYEYWWWLTEKSCDLYNVPRQFTTFYGYERSVSFPGGHRNVFHTRRGIPVVSFFTRTDFDRARPAGARHETLVEDDTRLLYESLRQTGGLSIPHSTGSNMGTERRDNDPDVEPVVEIFQGDRVSYEHPGGPRAARSAEDRPLGGYQEAGFVWNAYRKGYRIGTIASSDHWSTHISYAMVFTEQPTREAIFEAIHKRHTYGATDNIVLDVRMGEHFMGDDFAASEVPPLTVRVIGTAPIAQIEVIKDEKVVYSVNPGTREVTLTYLDQEPTPGTSYYYVRVIQEDREVAWGSPLWMPLRP